MPIATEQDKRDFDEIMKDDAKAREYWWVQLSKVLELNNILHEFVVEIDKMANHQQPLDAITVKMKVIATRTRVRTLAQTVSFGNGALE